MLITTWGTKNHTTLEDSFFSPSNVMLSFKASMSETKINSGKVQVNVIFLNEKIITIT